MTSPPLAFSPTLATPAGVYAPQHDSEFLVESMNASVTPAGRHVADLCTGSGFVAINAALAGARTVRAFDVSIAAVRCARANALAAGVDVTTHLGSWARAAEFGPFDLVLCNPPYVPEPPSGDAVSIPRSAGPLLAVDGGSDGRLVLDPLCEAAPWLLAEGGTMLLVHSEFSGVGASLTALRAAGLRASVVARRRVPFGPVLTARAPWLEATGQLEPGRRTEELVVVRADFA